MKWNWKKAKSDSVSESNTRWLPHSSFNLTVHCWARYIPECISLPQRPGHTAFSPDKISISSAGSFSRRMLLLTRDNVVGFSCVFFMCQPSQETNMCEIIFFSSRKTFFSLCLLHSPTQTNTSVRMWNYSYRRHIDQIRIKYQQIVFNIPITTLTDGVSGNLIMCVQRVLT